MTSYPSGYGPYAFIVAGGAFNEQWGLRLSSDPLNGVIAAPREVMEALGGPSHRQHLADSDARPRHSP